MPTKTITIPAKAIPKARPRKGKHGFYTPKTTQQFENFIKMIASRHFKQPVAEAEPIDIAITFKLPRPKRLTWKTKPMPEIPCASRPDLDNLEKSVLDGLQGIAFIDDRQVWKKTSKKIYHAGDGRPETIIEISWGGDI